MILKNIFIIVIILFTLFFSGLSYFYGSADYSQLGTLIILGITLVVLIQYAFDTHQMAKTQQKIYLTPSVTHRLSATEVHIVQNTFDIGFDLINHSSFYVEAYVNFSLKCYGIELHIPNGAYSGDRPWILPPNSDTIHGHFNLNNQLLQSSQHTITELRSRNKDPEMLSLSINIRCTSAHDIDLQIPEINYYFVFDRIVIPNRIKESGWVLKI